MIFFLLFLKTIHLNLLSDTCGNQILPLPKGFQDFVTGFVFLIVTGYPCAEDQLKV